MKQKRMLVCLAAMALLLLPGCGAAAAGSSAVASFRQAPSGCSAAESAAPQAEEWRLLSQSETQALWGRLGTGERGQTNCWWRTEKMQPEQIVCFFTDAQDAALSFLTGYEASDVGASYAVAHAETNGVDYRIFMAEGSDSAQHRMTVAFDASAAPVLTLHPNAADTRRMEVEWVWPAALEYETGQQVDGEMAGPTVEVTAMRAATPDELAALSQEGRTLALGEWHAAGAQLEAGFCSPQEASEETSLVLSEP